MSSYLDGHGIVLRGNSVDDPEDVGAGKVDILLGVKFLTAKYSRAQNALTDLNGRYAGGRGGRFTIDVETWPIARSSEDSSSWQHFGNPLYLAQRFFDIRWNFSRPLIRYTWLYITYRTASDTGSGPIPRGTFDGDTIIDHDTFWAHPDQLTAMSLPGTTPHLCPIPVVLDGDIDIGQAETGIIPSVKFRLFAAYPNQNWQS